MAFVCKSRRCSCGQHKGKKGTHRLPWSMALPDRIMRILSRGPRSKAELLGCLAKDVDPLAFETEVESLVSRGLVRLVRPEGAKTAWLIHAHEDLGAHLAEAERRLKARRSRRLAPGSRSDQQHPG